MRKANFAGKFYPKDFDELEKQIVDCFEGPLGPATLPISKRKGQIYGIVAPHAGYQFSGQAAAWAYKELAEASIPEIFIVIGVNHLGDGANFSISLEDFETPLLKVENDKDFSKHLIETAKEQGLDVGENEEAHNHEHSIEVQLPFLVFINKKEKFRFVPVLVSNYNYESCKNFAKAIIEVAEKLNKEICIVASGDFTHYGAAYGFVPFGPNKEKIYDLDRKAIDIIEKLNTEDFLDYTKKTTICGAGPIAITIEACKALGSERATLLRYYTSGDVSGDYNNAVGYAAIAFK